MANLTEIEQLFGVNPTAVNGVSEEVATLAESSIVNPNGATVDSIDVEKTNPAPMKQLAAFVVSTFRDNVDARKRSLVEEKLNYSLRTHVCSYNDEQIHKLVDRGIDPRNFSPITFTKNRAAKAMLIDLINAADEPLFLIQPTPKPDVGDEIEKKTVAAMFGRIEALKQELISNGVNELPPDKMAELVGLIKDATSNNYDTIANEEEAFAKNRAKRMQKKVEDIMSEGGFKKAFASYIDNICITGTGIIIGPIERTIACNECVTDKKNGIRKFRRVFRTKPVFESINPLDCYPAPDAEEVEDGPLCIRVKYTPNALWGFSAASKKRGRKDEDANGWNRGNIQVLLDRHPNGGVHLCEEQYNQERRINEGKDTENPKDCRFEGIRCFASVRGSMLIDLGIIKNRDGEDIDAPSFYKTETIVIDGLVVYCRIYDERLDLPISRGKFYELPGSWWGESISSKLFMCQYMQNMALKNLVCNMAVASGSQIWIRDVQTLLDKSPEGLKLKPWKAWAFGTSQLGNNGTPMGILSVPSNAGELMNVFNAFRTQADMDSGIPAFTEGQSTAQGGALRTSSGLAMYTEASNRGMKMVMTSTDNLVISRIAKMCADYELIYGTDMNIKGDVEVKPVGLIGRILKAQRDTMRQQVLAMCLNSQLLQQTIGVKGILALFRPAIQSIDLNPDDIVPNEERVKELELLSSIREILQIGGNDQQQMAEDAGNNEAGAPPGVSMPQMPQAQGGVAERRGVA